MSSGYEPGVVPRRYSLSGSESREFTVDASRVLGGQRRRNARKGHKLQAGLSGIIGEAFREMVSERTYAALESRALQGKPSGGKCYGYAPGEAEVVRQIFGWYVAGRSAQWSPPS